MQRLVVPLLLIALAAPATATAAPTELKAAQGQVAATLRGDAQENRDGLLVDVGPTTLEIARAGAIVRAATPLAPCRPQCGEREGSATASVYVRDLDGDAEPEVVVDRWRTGTVCCTGSLTVHRFNAGAYEAVAPQRLGSKYRLRNLDADAAPEIISDDRRFFTRFAPRVFGAYLPIRIHAYRAGRFTDVTRAYPAVVREDREQLAKLLARHQRRLDRGIRSKAENRGVIRALLPALLADDRMLGARKNADARLRRAVRRRDVSRRYAARVRTFLRRAGY